MKLRSSYPLLAAALLLPCCSALFNAALLSGGVFAAALTASLLILIVFIFKPTHLKKTYPKIYVIYDGCRQIKTFRVSIVFHIIMFILLKTIFKITFVPSLVFILVAYAVIMLLMISGGVRLFLASTQISLTLRVLMATLFWVPVANLIVMKKAERTAWQEFDREAARIELDNARAENEICKTKYPILLVHGIFFRDLNFFNYWGRVPKELIKNGADIYYGDQPSAASVEECGNFLKDRIDDIISMTGCEKVNIIAHSKGGLDSRYAAALPGCAEHIASITTVNTPHRGCLYADYLLGKLPKTIISWIAAKYNAALSRFGEKADFIEGVTDLTAARCAEFNETHPIPEGVYCRSVGSYMKKSTSAGFPLNFAYVLVKLFSRTENDGLVDLESMKWGDSFTVYSPKTKRGISHGDAIDLFREDISGYDVREVYVKLVEDLKNRGL